MTPERHRHVGELYHAALAVALEERAAFLAAASGGDAELQREVESLLTAHAQAGSFIVAPAAGAFTGLPTSGLEGGAAFVGRRMGAYTIQGALGAGGMGEVYRARDGTLGRDVAIKILPRVFSTDPDRRARFDREARLLAALNHPHIGAIYGVEESDGIRALVLELVEGDTLADRLARGPIPVSEALRIARQIADALEAAHEKGIVHRDLKPANIKITPEDVVKVLDFGLAKAALGDVSGPHLTHAPTLTSDGTRDGVILGTAAYMSPEQARGKPVDKRADIWAFGCVLYEMLTGRAVVTGETLSDMLAAILEREPDWQALPLATPGKIQDLLRYCLQKDPHRRLRDIGDARLEESRPEAPVQVLEAGGGRGSDVAVRPTTKLSWLATAAALVALGALAFVHFRETQPEPQVLTYTIDAPAKSTPLLSVISPDGRHVAIVALGERQQLWVRSLDSLETRPLPGTDGAAFPFWSPDNSTIAFFANGELKKIAIAIAGGPAVKLCDAPLGRGGSWNSEGVIIFGNAGGDIKRVAIAGGVPVSITKGDPPAGHRFPIFLPDGRRFLYLANTRKEPGIYAASLDSKPDDPRQRVVTDLSNPQYLPPSAGGSVGHLLFVREGTLMAQPLNPESLQLAGDEFPVAGRIGFSGVNEFYTFSASTNGVLVHLTGDANLRQITRYDRSRTKLGTLGEPYVTGGRLALSPDGKRLVSERGESASDARDLWMTDVERGTESRFTFEAGAETNAVWHPDGNRVAFAAFMGNASPMTNLYQRAANGAAGQNDLLLDSEFGKYPSDWTRDGKYLIYRHSDAGGKHDLYALPVTGDKKPIPLLTSNANEVMGTVSPDGRWLAYASDENGNYEVYVQPFTPGKPSTGKRQISLGDGRDPHWRDDSKELFYVTQDRKMMAVDIRAVGESIESDAPHELFKMPYSTAGNITSRYSVTKDGQSFFMAAEVESTEASPIYVTVNWLASVKK